MALIQKYKKGDELKRLEEELKKYLDFLNSLPTDEDRAAVQQYLDGLVEYSKSAPYSNVFRGAKRQRLAQELFYKSTVEHFNGADNDDSIGAAYEPSIWSKDMPQNVARLMYDYNRSRTTAQPLASVGSSTTQQPENKRHIFFDLTNGIGEGLSSFSFGDRLGMIKDRLNLNIQKFLDKYGDGTGVYVNGIDRESINSIKLFLNYLSTYNPEASDNDKINWGINLVKGLYTLSPGDLGTVLAALPELFKEPSQEDKNRALINGTELTNLSEPLKNWLTLKNLHLIKDDAGNITAYTSDWEKYSGDGLDNISLNSDTYGQGFIIGSDGRVFYGNVGDIDENHWANYLLDEAKNRRGDLTNLFYIRDFNLDTDYIDNYLVNRFINYQRKKNENATSFNYADVSNLFGDGTLVIAFDETGTPIKLGLFKEFKLTPTMKFAWLDGKTLKIGNFDDAKNALGGFNISGRGEKTDQTGKIVGLSNDIFNNALGISKDTYTKKFNFKTLTGLMGVGAVDGATAGAILTGGPGALLGGLIGALGTGGAYILGLFIDRETIGDNPLRFVNSVVTALKNPKAKISVPGSFLTYTGSGFLNQFESRLALIETVGVLVNEGYASLNPEDLLMIRTKYYLLNKQNIPEGTVNLHNNGGILKAAYGSAVPKLRDDLDFHEESKSREVKLEEKDSQKASEEVYANSDVYRANKTTELKPIDSLRFLTMAQDVASIVASFVPGAGTGVAAGLGVTSLGTDLVADIMDPAVTAGEVIKNAGINAGFAAFGLIPGAKMHKVAKNIIKFLPRIVTVAAGLGIAFDESTLKTLKKLSDGKTKLNREDWRNLSHVLSLLAGATRGVKGEITRYKVNKKGTIIAKDNIGIKGLTDAEGNVKQFQKETVDEVNKALSKIKTSDLDANTKAIKVLTDKLKITEDEAVAVLKTPRLQSINGGVGKYRIETEKVDNKRASYEALRQMWNKEAADVKLSSDLARRFARRFGGGEYTATQRAILENHPEFSNMHYEAYNPIVDWGRLRLESDATIIKPALLRKKIESDFHIGDVHIKNGARVKSYVGLNLPSGIKQDGYINIDPTELSRIFPRKKLRGSAYNPATNELIIWKQGGLLQ